MRSAGPRCSSSSQAVSAPSHQKRSRADLGGRIERQDLQSQRRGDRGRRGAWRARKRRASSSSRAPSWAAGPPATRGRSAPHHARVTDHHHAVVVFTADEPADALLQSQRGLGQLVVLEGVAALAVRCSMRALTMGSSGEANGSFSMMTRRSAAPFTSTPSQKLAVPSSTALPSSRNSRSSARAAPRPVRTAETAPLHPSARAAARPPGSRRDDW